uniref:LOW QUALITY PROTEIN: protein N-lysine methyltransferase METTL21A-like n=1 Tax=Elaeis guineensis var. tenera TaxID=51953 RepID=A0A6J0PK29_ELAGV|nr:LOW QUALITY PROTEIN: protein N-lysine methyltransferase METTL21A-like [Elaeis guineensis]
MAVDYDLTGQLVWAGAVLLNIYLSKNAEILDGRSVIELGSGVGNTGILCNEFCQEVVLTDHNKEFLEARSKHHLTNFLLLFSLTAEKLEWGNSVEISGILQKHPGAFDLVLGDIGNEKEICRRLKASVNHIY